MGRPKGYKMSDAQKKAMAEGRKRAQEERLLHAHTKYDNKLKVIKVSEKKTIIPMSKKNIEIEEEDGYTRSKNSPMIVGYSYPEPFANGNGVHSYPIFSIEKDSYKGKIYPSPQEAMEAYNRKEKI